MSRKIFGALLVSGLALTAAACDVDKTKDGEAPSVSVDAGKLPEYDVKTPEVNVSAETTQVVTPKVTVTPADSVKPKTNQ